MILLKKKQKSVKALKGWFTLCFGRCKTFTGRFASQTLQAF